VVRIDLSRDEASELKAVCTVRAFPLHDAIITLHASRNRR